MKITFQEMAGSAMGCLLVLLVWEAGHGFRARDMHIDTVEVRVSGECGRFVRSYDNAGWGELVARRDEAHGQDGEFACAVVYDDDAGRLAVSVCEERAKARTGADSRADVTREDVEDYSGGDEGKVFHVAEYTKKGVAE